MSDVAILLSPASSTPPAATSGLSQRGTPGEFEAALRDTMQPRTDIATGAQAEEQRTTLAELLGLPALTTQLSLLTALQPIAALPSMPGQSASTGSVAATGTTVASAEPVATSPSGKVATTSINADEGPVATLQPVPANNGDRGASPLAGHPHPPIDAVTDTPGAVDRGTQPEARVETDGVRPAPAQERRTSRPVEAADALTSDAVGPDAGVEAVAIAGNPTAVAGATAQPSADSNSVAATIEAVAADESSETSTNRQANRPRISRGPLSTQRSAGHAFATPLTRDGAPSPTGGTTASPRFAGSAAAGTDSQDNSVSSVVANRPNNRRATAAYVQSEAAADRANHATPVSTVTRPASAGTPATPVARVQRPIAPAPVEQTTATTGSTGGRTVDQVASALSIEIKGGRTEATIALRPAALGAIKVQISTGADGMVIRLSAERDAVGELLRSQMSDLRDALAGHQVAVAELHVLHNPPATTPASPSTQEQPAPPWLRRDPDQQASRRQPREDQPENEQEA